jgi:signal transduction histidine kinase
LDHNGSPKSYIAIRTDITDRITKEKTFLQQSRLAQMGEMISMIAHQWRQPLAAVSAACIDMRVSMALDKFAFASKEDSVRFHTFFDQKMDDIELYVQSLTTTIDDFRNFYKPNKKSVSCSIEKPLEHAMKIIESSLLNNNIKLIKELHSKRKFKLYDSELMQVILNILKNAQDNFFESKTQDAVITITTHDYAETTVLEICDNGGGIDTQIIHKIFEPYFSTKDEKNGTGLGLYMSKTIVEEHHKGILAVKNHDNGACFTITLPVNKKV